MATKAEIQAKYLTQHDALGTWKDAGDKELFKQKHGEIWHNCDVELQERKTYLETQINPIPEEQQELRELQAMIELGGTQ